MSTIAENEDCPSEEDIAAYVDGLLPPPQVERFEAHVADCSTCRGLLSALARGWSHRPTEADSASPTLPLGDFDEASELSIGAGFGRYLVLDPLGAGGMGLVYAAHDPELNRKVALKVLRREIDEAGHAARDLLLREAQAMAQLAHPNVVTVFDVGSVGDRVFFAMELVDGLTLTKWLIAAPRTLDDVIAKFVAAGSGLAAAHEAGLIHRDFKPDNVLVGGDGRVRVTDFGLARALPTPAPVTAPVVTMIKHAVHGTQSAIAGTLAYMAPEVLRGRSADARADQYSFALSLYQALYGIRPSAVRGIATHAEMPPPPGNVPAMVHAILARALDDDPTARYASMAALLAELQGARDLLLPRPLPQKRSSTAATAAVVLTIAVIITASVYTVHIQRTAERRTELIGWLRGISADLRMRLRTAYILPLHDIRPARQQVRQMMREVERRLATPAGNDVMAFGNYVLGEGHRALGEHQRALALLESARSAGERSPELDVALGHVLGAIYEREQDDLERTVPSHKRDGKLRELEQRYRDPARRHLRSALDARAGSPDYLEALLAFHDGQFAKAQDHAAAAFRAAPTFYEAGILQAKAHNAMARALLAAGDTGSAQEWFANARRMFKQVLNTARSDDQARLEYAALLWVQAQALAQNALPAELRAELVEALDTVQKINPENAEALLYRAKLHELEANIAIIQSRDPSSHVTALLDAAERARRQGASQHDVARIICMGHWLRAAYRSNRRDDPYADFAAAISTCESAAAATPTAEAFASVGAVYISLAFHQGEHGIDPMSAVLVGERHLRASLAIDDNARDRHNLGRLWSNLARYEERHGRDPLRSVERALAEFGISTKKDARRADAWGGMADAMIIRARFLATTTSDPALTEEATQEASELLDTAQSIDPGLVGLIRSRMAIAEIDAESRLRRRLDPTPAIERIRDGARSLLNSVPSDSYAYVMQCRAELLAMRWVVLHEQVTRPVIGVYLLRAARFAERARQLAPRSALAWVAGAKVEHMRITSLGHPVVTHQAIAHGRKLLVSALEIDPQLTAALQLRDALDRAFDRSFDR